MFILMHKLLSEFSVKRTESLHRFFFSSNWSPKNRQSKRLLAVFHQNLPIYDLKDHLIPLLSPFSSNLFEDTFTISMQCECIKLATLHHSLFTSGKEMEEPSISPQKEDLTAIKTQRLHDRRLRRHHMEVHPPPNTNLSSFPVRWNSHTTRQRGTKHKKARKLARIVIFDSQKPLKRPRNLVRLTSLPAIKRLWRLCISSWNKND